MLKKYAHTLRGKESIKRSSEKFRLANPNWQKDYYQKNKEKAKEKNKEYREKHKDEVKIKQKEWYSKNIEKQKLYSVKRRYGVNPEQYNNMFNKQNGICAICFEKKELVVDHCHETGRVRGLLCKSCNFGIGNLKDSVLLLESAKQYLCKK